MTNYTATGNSKHATLTASTVDVVTLPGAYLAIEVTNRDSTNDLYFTIDGGHQNVTQLTPTIGGDGCYYVGPGGVCRVSDDQTRDAATRVIRLISVGAAPYSVTGYGN